MQPERELQSFITLKRILIIQTICVCVRGASPLVDLMWWPGRPFRSADKRNEKSKTVLHRSLWQNNNYFLMRLLCLCLPVDRLADRCVLCYARPSHLRAAPSLDAFNEMYINLGDVGNGQMHVFHSSLISVPLRSSVPGVSGALGPLELR